MHVKFEDDKCDCGHLRRVHKNGICYDFVFVGMFDESTVEEDACKCEHFHQTHR